MQANTNHVERAIGEFNWEVVLTNCDANDQVIIFDIIISIINIMKNFIPSEGSSI